MTTETILVLTEELAEKLLEELGLDHPDTGRLVNYVWLVQSYPLASKGEDYYRDNLAKWVEDEQGAYFGEHDSESDFCQHYLENYCEYSLPDWVVIDYATTWSGNLRHDFITDNSYSGGVWVWAVTY
jgi:hypothetical protein